MSFDGANDYMALNNASQVSEWTISTWVKRHSDVLSATLSSSSKAALKLEQIYQGTKLGLTVFGVADHVFKYATPKDKWQHLTFVGGGGKVKLFVNGKLVDQLNVSINLPLEAIGRRSSGGEHAHMTIDDFKVFHSALSNAKVAELYSATSAGGGK